MNLRWQLIYLVRDLVVAPQTFFKPGKVATSAAPTLGDLAPRLPLLQPGRPAIVAFLRHVGCPFAEVTVRSMGTTASHHRTVDFIVVTHSPEGPSRAWCDAVQMPCEVQLLADPARAHHAAWGVGLTDREHFTGKASMNTLWRLLDAGIHNRRAHGSRWQGAATFAVDANGVLRWRHLPVHAGDLPPFADAVAAIDIPRGT